SVHLEKIDDNRWLIPKSYKPGMRTDTMVYANERLLGAIRKDQSLEQAANVAMLLGIVGRALAMPDIHQGYGFPIGGVAAVDEEHGVVSPGGVGFDINCGEPHASRRDNAMLLVHCGNAANRKTITLMNVRHGERAADDSQKHRHVRRLFERLIFTNR